MEIKEINNLTNMIMGKTASVQAASSENDKKPSAGTEFIDLLNNKDFFGGSVADDKAEETVFSRIEDKKTSRKTKNKTVKYAASENQPRTEEKSSPKDSPSSAEKTQNKPEASKPERQPAEKAETPQTDKPIRQDNKTAVQGENTVAEENVSAASPVEDGADLSSENIINENVFGQEIPLAEVSEMGAVTVFNAATNTYTVMTGSDLAEMMSSGEMSLVPVMSLDGRSDITLLPADALPQNTTPAVETSGIDISAMQIADGGEEFASLPDVSGKSTVAGDKNIMQDIVENNIVEAPLENANIVEEAAKLGEAVGEGRKAEVKVTVNEEKFSYAAAKSDFSAQEVLQSAVSDELAVQDMPELPSSASAPQTVTAAPQQNQAQQLNLFAFAGQNQNNAVVAENASGSVAAVSELASSTASHSALSADMSTAVKTEARAEVENKTALRDVYKGMGREAVEQIKVNITKSAVKGVDTINVQLKPEELGHIEIKMQIAKDGKLQAHIISSRAETMDMLQKEMPALEKAFNDAGFETDGSSFSFSFREDRQAGEQNESGRGLRSFLGDVLDKEAGNENLAEETAAYGTWDGKSALNIRV
ncbi:MAG: flagellar hook-length control protein FliK [Pseudomonadota bacterium]|nr:flagellar hook-length control protein FliK [Pseudomonadota bacterium]